MQPFGYTGYQMEAAGGLYFAQARRYDAENGRFVSEDKIPRFTSAPFTLNRYNYCWNQPMEYVDLNGKFLWIVIPLIIEQILEEIGEANGQFGSGMIYKYYEIDDNLYVSIDFSSSKSKLFDRVLLIRLCTQDEILDTIYPR